MLLFHLAVKVESFLLIPFKRGLVPFWKTSFMLPNTLIAFLNWTTIKTSSFQLADGFYLQNELELDIKNNKLDKRHRLNIFRQYF